MKKIFLPDWVSLRGLLEHVVIGAAALLLMLVLPLWLALLTGVLGIALAHEQAQRDWKGRTWSDFRTGQAQGGWWLNGVLDVVAFLVGGGLVLLAYRGVVALAVLVAK